MSDIKLFRIGQGSVSELSGTIETLGLDENGCPVILEYKRAQNENVINQGLFYLDLLVDHRKDFQWLVLENLARRKLIPSISQRRALFALPATSTNIMTTPSSRCNETGRARPMQVTSTKRFRPF